MNKICILVYDALDINLIEEFDFPNLKQEEYGKVDISDFKKTSTPIISASFLSGKNLQDEFIDPPSSKTEKISNLSRNLYHFFRDHISTSLTLKIKKFLRDSGISKGLRTGTVNANKRVREIGVETILDYFDSYAVINVPTVNQKHTEINYALKDVLEERITKQEYEAQVWQNFEVNKKELLDSLDKNQIIAWFKPPDWLGHLYRPDLEKMRDIYLKMERLTEKVKEQFDGWVLVLGDHGMEPLGEFGDHSDLDYGYYSSNIELGLDNPKMTDFHDLIVDYVQGEKGIESKKETETREKEGENGSKQNEEKTDRDEEEDRKEMLKRMEELGYW